MSKKELNNDLFESMLRHAAHAEVLRIADEASSQAELINEIKLSLEFEKRMQKLIETQKNKARLARTRSALAKVAVGFAAFLIISFSIVFSAEALRIKVLNFFLEKTEDSYIVNFDNNGDEVLVKYYPEYIPIGYELQRTEEYFSSILYIYINGDGELLQIYQMTNENTLKIDTESRSINVLDREGLYNQAKGSLIFTIDEYCFIIQGQIPLEDMLKIAENIKK